MTRIGAVDHRGSGIVRTRVVSFMLASLLTVSATAGGVVAAPAVGAAPVPKCTFNNSALPIVMGVKAGSVVKVACTGLTANNPYLVLQASLLIGIDPQAKALLSGNSGLSAAALTAALAALPKINPASLTSSSPTARASLRSTTRCRRRRPLTPTPPARHRKCSSTPVSSVARWR